jgi:drug/metabolite transporter (DMT)-like permease
MTLVAWGETHIDSGIAAIAQASVPIFVVLLSLRFLPHEPLGASRIAGLAIGIAGVGLITGVHPEGGWWAVVGTLAVVLSSLSYASGGGTGSPGPRDAGACARRWLDARGCGGAAPFGSPIHRPRCPAFGDGGSARSDLTVLEAAPLPCPATCTGAGSRLSPRT